MSSSFAVDWTKLVGTSGSENADTLSISSDGSVYIGGELNGFVNGFDGDGFITNIFNDE